MQPENKSDTVTPQESPEVPAEKLPYRAPEFVTFGSITELTKGAIGTEPDGGGGSVIPS